jgi:hypothetical protein
MASHCLPHERCTCSVGLVSEVLERGPSVAWGGTLLVSHQWPCAPARSRGLVVPTLVRRVSGAWLILRSEHVGQVLKQQARLHATRQDRCRTANHLLNELSACARGHRTRLLIPATGTIAPAGRVSVLQSVTGVTVLQSFASRFAGLMSRLTLPLVRAASSAEATARHARAPSPPRPRD